MVTLKDILELIDPDHGVDICYDKNKYISGTEYNRVKDYLDRPVKAIRESREDIVIELDNMEEPQYLVHGYYVKLRNGNTYEVDVYKNKLKLLGTQHCIFIDYDLKTLKSNHDNSLDVMVIYAPAKDIDGICRPIWERNE